MKNIAKIISLISLTIITMSACAPKADIFIQQSGDAVITLDIKTGKTVDTLLESTAQFTDEEKTESSSIFKIEEIKRALEEKGIKVLSMSTESVGGINTKIKIMNKDMNDENAFVKTDMKAGLLSLSIGPENIKEFVNMLSDDDKEYIDLLMAPAITGEDLSVEEYEDLIKQGYGEKLAKELKKSKFNVSLTCPRKIKSITIKPFGFISKNGNKGTVDIPLSELLCVKDPIFIEVKF